MSIKVGDVGKSLYVSSGQYNLSGNTSLTIETKKPDNTTGPTLTGVTAPATNSPDIPGSGVFSANLYGLYKTSGADFDVAGDWQIRLVYQDATPKKFHGEFATLTIGE